MPGLPRHPLQDTEIYHGKPDVLSGRDDECLIFMQ